MAEWVPASLDEVKRQAVLSVLGRFEIQENMGRRIQCLLTGRKKVLVLDNSGSMSGRVAASSLVTHTAQVTRTDELVAFLQIALPFLVADCPEGVDVWLLNNGNGQPCPTVLRHVQTLDQVLPYVRPNGSTPLVQCLRAVFQAYAGNMAEEGLHVLVATDGEPNDDDDGTPGRKALFNLLRHGSPLRPRPHQCIVNFLVCTDVADDVAYLDHLDVTCPRIDVTDDYAAERAQAAQAGALSRPMSVADWVFKALIGTADTTLDSVDEVATRTGHASSAPTATHVDRCSCCAIL